MKAVELLHKNLSKACPQIHSVRLSALMSAITSVITGQQLTVTGLGRNLKSNSKTVTKHDIKRMDRIVGSQHLHIERKALYGYLLRQLVGQQKHPILIADWSPIPSNEIFQVHRVSIPMGGRTLTVYEECFEEKYLNNTEVHKNFLDELEELLPEGCQPIILSDAIYKTQWFQAIQAKGWFWIGRVRGNVQLSLDDSTFKGCAEIMESATGRPTSLGTLLYSKKTKFPCQGVLFRGKAKGTHQKKKRGGTSKDGKSIYYSDKAKQPWLLIYHLPKVYCKPKNVVKLYRCRMQIEEGFRDTKNQQYGLGLAQAKSKSAKRYDNLLLIAALALFVLWCIGQAAVDQKYHHKLQANTVRNKTVLSKIYLAMQVINDRRYRILSKDLRHILNTISDFTQKVESLVS